jgi:hypothetical protein
MAPDSPIGEYVAELPATTGLGLWVPTLKDGAGTLTVSVGADVAVVTGFPVQALSEYSVAVSVNEPLTAPPVTERFRKMAVEPVTATHPSPLSEDTAEPGSPLADSDT